MTLPPPLAHGTTPVQGFTNAQEIRLLDEGISSAFVCARRLDVAGPAIPVVLVPLALDASGQRVIPEELVERVSGEMRRAGFDVASSDYIVRCMLSAALLSAGSLGLGGRT